LGKPIWFPGFFNPVVGNCGLGLGKPNFSGNYFGVWLNSTFLVFFKKPKWFQLAGYFPVFGLFIGLPN